MAITSTRARLILAVGTLSLFGYSQVNAASTTVTSYSTALAANLSVLNLISVGVNPVAFAIGTAPTPYSSNQTLLTLSNLSDLGVGSFSATTSLIADTASSGYLPTLSGSATSTVNDLDTRLGLPIVGSLLKITATTLTSTSSASDLHGLVLTGSSEIENLYISGLALGNGGIHLNAGALAATPVNDILLNIAGLVVVANYQTSIYDNGVVDGIQTSALAIGLNNFAFGGDLLSGTVLIADSAAYIPNAPNAVPEPAAWAVMLAGFGMIGVAARRRRGLAAA